MGGEAQGAGQGGGQEGGVKGGGGGGAPHHPYPPLALIFRPSLPSRSPPSAYPTPHPCSRPDNSASPCPLLTSKSFTSTSTPLSRAAVSLAASPFLAASMADNA